MDKLKLILIGLGVIFAGILVYMAVSVVMSLFWYLVVFGVVVLAGVGAYKLLLKPKRQQLKNSQAGGELNSAQKLLKEYERELAKLNDK